MPSALRREICAFANATSGAILLGVSDAGEMEQIGSGIRRIRQLCREHEVAAPAIDVSEHWVTTTFFRPTAEVGDQIGTKEGVRQYQPESLEWLGIWRNKRNWHAEKQTNETRGAGIATGLPFPRRP